MVAKTADMIRLLGPGDEAALEAFLFRHAETSMFLRSNAHAAGLVDRGEPLQATYAALVEEGVVEAVVAHCWNGMVLVQAPRALPALIAEARRATGRAIAGVTGPYEQVREAANVLGLTASRPARDVLLTLALDALQVPEPLARGEVICRRPRPDELELLTDWRCDYLVETGLQQPGPRLREISREGIRLSHSREADFVLEEGGQPVAYSAFNAQLPDIVQIGGVWTPPALRRGGKARSVVAGSLLMARKAGVRRAVLFTQETNVPAQRAYESLGFRAAGDYGLLMAR